MRSSLWQVSISSSREMSIIASKMAAFLALAKSCQETNGDLYGYLLETGIYLDPASIHSQAE